MFSNKQVDAVVCREEPFLRIRNNATKHPVRVPRHNKYLNPLDDSDTHAGEYVHIQEYCIYSCRILVHLSLPSHFQ